MTELNAAGAELTLSDGPHRLRLTFNSLVEVEEKYGTLHGAQAELEVRPLSSSRFLLWAALLHEHTAPNGIVDPNWSQAAAGDLIGPSIDFGEVLYKITLAMAEALGKNVADEMVRLHELAEAGDGDVVLRRMPDGSIVTVPAKEAFAAAAPPDPTVTPTGATPPSPSTRSQT